MKRANKMMRVLKPLLFLLLPSCFIFTGIAGEPIDISTKMRDLDIIVDPKLSVEKKVQLLTHKNRDLKTEEINIVLNYCNKCDLKLLKEIVQIIRSNYDVDKEDLLSILKLRLSEKSENASSHLDLLELWMGWHGPESERKLSFQSPLMKEAAQIVLRAFQQKDKDWKFISAYMLKLHQIGYFGLFAMNNDALIPLAIVCLDKIEDEDKQLKMLEMINEYPLIETIIFEEDSINIIRALTKHRNKNISNQSSSLLEKISVNTLSGKNLKMNTLEEHLNLLGKDDIAIESKRKIIDRIALRKLNKDNINVFFNFADTQNDVEVLHMCCGTIMYILHNSKIALTDDQILFSESYILRHLNRLKNDFDEDKLSSIVVQCLMLKNEKINKELVSIFNSGSMPLFNSQAAIFLIKNRKYRETAINYYIQYLKSTPFNRMGEKEKMRTLSFLQETGEDIIDGEGNWITDNKYWIKVLERIK